MKHRINRLFSLFICCLFFLQHQVTDSAYTNGYNMIREFDVDSRFAADAASWSVVGGQMLSPAYTTCGTTMLMGGYCVLGCSGCSQIGKYYQRYYTGLPPHNSIRFEFTFWAIDSWDLAQTGHDDGFELGFDSTTINGWYMSLSTFPVQVCGVMTSAWNELPMRVFGTVPHTASTLTFRFYSDLNEDSCNESFGFRDISLIFDQNPATGQTMCGKASITLPNKNCQCPEGQYWTGSSCAACNYYCSSCFGPSASECYACRKSDAITYDGTKCVPCYSGCATCFGGASMQCLTCVTGFVYIPYTRECATLYCPWPLVATVVSGQTQCLTPCSSIDLFVYPDGVTCSSSCPAPFQQETFHTVIKYCINPCSPTEYLYWDGSCQHDCAYPLTIQNTYRNQKLCTYSCALNQYLYWDGSCQASCDSPLLNRTQNSKYFCLKPCATGQYLYWNGDCVNSCTGYLTITTSSQGVTLCNYPCSTTQYLYWDGSCQSTCPYPLQTRVEKERNYCDYPTSSANFLYWDGTSSATCSGTTLSQRTEGNSPYQRKFCDNTCSEYLYWNGSCFYDCPYPLTITVTNNKQYCGYACSGSTPYLYWNGSCGGSCNSPYKTRTEGGKTFCDYPCLTDQYLYWDGTCSYDCSGYLVERLEGSPMIRKFCDFPCQSTEFLYWNGSCKTSCTIGPFVQTTVSGNKYCNFKCSGGQYYYSSDGVCRDGCDATYLPRIENSVEKYCGLLPSYALTCSDYYYWNHTCHTTCPSPLVSKTVGTQNWCLYPCQINQFLYPDSRCFDTCDVPFTVREELGYKYCDYLCDSSSFAYWNGSCLPTCLSPLRSQTTRYGQSCLKPCDNSAIYYHAKTGTCMEECSAPALSPDGDYPECLVYTPVKSDGSFLDVFIQGPSTPGTPSFASIIKMLQYVRFLDIEMPPRLRDLTMTRGRSVVTLRFGQYMSDEMIATYTGEDLPDVFTNHHMHSEFIVNFWGELSSWALIGLVIVFLAVFESICVLKNWKGGQNVFGKLKILARWNLPLIMLATSLDDIVFFTALEIIGIGSTSGLSIVLCLVMLALIIMVVIAIKKLVPVFVVAKRKIVLYNNPGDYESFLEKWKDCQILYKGFRDHIQPNDYFFLLYMGRIAFPMLIASILFAVPIVQASIYVMLSLAVLGYIIYMKPLNRKINHLQLILIESIVLVVNIALLGLSIIDIRKAWGSEAFVALGDIVVYGNLALNLLLVIFLVAKIVDGALAIHKEQKKDRSLWLQLIVFYLQQGGMGFEEMFIDNKAAEIFNQRQYVIDEEKRLVEVERERLFAVKKNKLLDNEGDSPLARDTNRRSTFLKRTTIIEEPTQEEEKRPSSLIINPQKIEMDDRHKLINETSFVQSPGFTFTDEQGSPERDRIRDVVSTKFNLDSNRAGSIHDRMRSNFDSPPDSNRMMVRGGNFETLSLTKVDSNSSPPAARGNEKRLGIDFNNGGGGNDESTYDNQNSFIMRNIQKQNISGFSNHHNNNN